MAAGVGMVGRFLTLWCNQQFRKDETNPVCNIPQICGSPQGMNTFGVVPVVSILSFLHNRKKPFCAFSFKLCSSFQK